MVEQTAQNFMTVIVILGAAVVILGALWGVRLINTKRIAQSKKNPDGLMAMEVWRTDGSRVVALVRKLPGGFEVEAPRGLKESLRYFYSKTAIYTVQYPSWVPFDFLRVSVPIASWMENVSSAIDPEAESTTQAITLTEDAKAGSELTVTLPLVKATQAIPADMQMMLQEKNTLSMQDEMLRDGEDRQQALRNLITSIRGLKWLPYMAGGALIASAAGAAMVWQMSQALGIGG